MCGWTDPEDAIEEEITIKGKELVYFSVFYLLAVIVLLVFYEVTMPVINNPNYPFYNKKPDYTFHH